MARGNQTGGSINKDELIDRIMEQFSALASNSDEVRANTKAKAKNEKQDKSLGNTYKGSTQQVKSRTDSLKE